MSPDAFEASETVSQSDLDRLRSAANAGLAEWAAGPDTKLPPPPMDAIQQDRRLKECGLVQYDDQLTSKRWIGPAGSAAARLFPHRVTVLPLYLVQPKPGMEIVAPDGERYELDKDFKGDWFAVVSPKGVALIP